MPTADAVEHTLAKFVVEAQKARRFRQSFSMLRGPSAISPSAVRWEKRRETVPSRFRCAAKLSRRWTDAILLARRNSEVPQASTGKMFGRKLADRVAIKRYEASDRHILQPYPRAARAAPSPLPQASGRRCRPRCRVAAAEHFARSGAATVAHKHHAPFWPARILRHAVKAPAPGHRGYQCIRPRLSDQTPASHPRSPVSNNGIEMAQ